MSLCKPTKLFVADTLIYGSATLNPQWYEYSDNGDLVLDNGSADVERVSKLCEKQRPTFKKDDQGRYIINKVVIPEEELKCIYKQGAKKIKRFFQVEFIPVVMKTYKIPRLQNQIHEKDSL